MIPQALVERAAALMRDDEPVAEMLNAMLDHYRNPLLHADKPLSLDPRVFNAHTFERVEGRARLVGDGELAAFMREFAKQRKAMDEEQERIAEAAKEGRVISFAAAGELFRALKIQNDQEILSLRIQGFRLAQLMGQPAFALVKDRPLAVVQ